MNRKICIFCDRTIPPYNITCPEHYREYLQYKNEPWCKAIAKMNERQFQIDKHESVSIHGLTDVEYSPAQNTSTKAAPKEEILRLFYEKKLKVRKIANILNLPYHTVYAVIRRNKKK